MPRAVLSWHKNHAEHSIKINFLELPDPTQNPSKAKFYNKLFADDKSTEFCKPL